MIDGERRHTELDVIAHEGNVMLRDWLNDRVVTSHTITPLKAKWLAQQLLDAADRADKTMPKL